jgi:putative transcriptional regulator
VTVQHHLNDDLLGSYAAGTLSEGWSIAVATHLALCPICRNRLDKFECLGGQLLETLPVEKLPDSSWETLRGRLTGDKAALPSRLMSNEMVLPEPLRSYAGGDVHQLKWRSLGRGAYQVPISTGDDGTTVRLLKVPAGKPVPEHGHGGRELTLVLSGSFVDGDDKFSRGDIEDADADLVHQPKATPDADCICLAVTDAPLRFRSWFIRLLQPVIGI